MSAPGPVTLLPVTGVPEVARGADLGALLLAALTRAGVALQDGDVLVVSSKVVSKAMGLRVPHDPDAPGAAGDKEQEVLRRSRAVVAERRGPAGTTRVVHAEAGPVMAAAGIDASNTGGDGGLLLLPGDPDLAARELYGSLLRASSPAPLPRIGVVLSDTAGRPWRAGQVDFALGCCGLAVLEDLRGGRDVDGRDLAVTERAVADEVAAAADLVKSKASGVPAAVVRGLPPELVGDLSEAGARELVRTGATDWFALGTAEAVRSALGAHPGTPEAEQVGVPSMLPEPWRDRLARALALAVLGEDPAVRCEPEGTAAPDGHVVRVHGGTELARGRVAARLEVALHAERLVGPLAHDAPALRVLTGDAQEKETPSRDEG